MPDLPPLFRYILVLLQRIKTLTGGRVTPIVLVALLVASSAAFTKGHFWISDLDRQAESIAHRTVVQTATLFAVAKGINSALSMASTVTVGAGAFVNGSVEPGKLLDPLDRLIDDFSDYLLAAAAAACLTELLLTIDRGFGPHYFLIFCSLFAVALFMLRQGTDDWRGQTAVFCRMVLAAAIVLRIGFPLVMVSTHQGYELFLAPHYDQAQVTLSDIMEKTKVAYSGGADEKDHSDEGFITRIYGSASDKVSGLKAAGAVFKNNFDHFFDAIFTLTAVMALQIVILPLLLGWMTWRITKHFTQNLWLRRSRA
jgi:hypothetical protein